MILKIILLMHFCWKLVAHMQLVISPYIQLGLRYNDDFGAIVKRMRFPFKWSVLKKLKC